MNEGFLALVEDQSNLDPIMYQYFNHYKNHRTIVFNRAVDDSIVETVILPLLEYENDDIYERVMHRMNELVNKNRPYADPKGKKLSVRKIMLFISKSIF